MKALLTLTLFFITLNAFSFEAKVTEVKLGMNDERGEKTLCLTVLTVEGQEIGILEDLHDCFYAQKFNKVSGQTLEIELPLNKMLPPSDALTSHLPKRMYLFSDFD